MSNDTAARYANQYGYSDVYPGEVIRVVSDVTMDVRMMDAEMDPSWKPEIVPGGFLGHCVNQDEQRWLFESNPGLPIFRIRRTKKGQWQDKWGNKFYLSDTPRRKHDYNF